MDELGTRVQQRLAGGERERGEQRGDRRIRAGRETFTCEPPSEVVEVELAGAARTRLEDCGRLAVTVRIEADGYSAPRDAPIMIRIDE